jgi:pimeloyl-ACP methyl ester carboxylesterase/DNA-binding CsgD family transcriptional regulator
MQSVHYARTQDGISIAYSSAGRGAPVVFASNPCELHENSPHPHTQFMTDRLVGLGWRVFRYDLRGMGASDRHVADMSLDALTLDIDAVVDRAGLDRFALVGTSAGAAVAVAYAAARPGRVSRLVILDPFSTGRAWAEFSPLRRMLELIAQLAEDDWASFTLAAGNVVTGFDGAKEARKIAASLEHSASPRTFLQYEDAMKTVDVRPLLPRIEAPALVLHNTDFPIGSFEMSREVATSLPDAQFSVVSGEDAAEIEAIDTFLRPSVEARTGPSQVQAEAGGSGRLTPRELDVLRLIARGRTNREMSEDLVLSERTVARHITNIYAKLDLRSKAEATAYALRHDLN